MKLGVLFSGGKDSCYAAWLAKKQDHDICCLISVFSENKDSYMFHTPSIERVRFQAEAMDVPLVVGKTKGEKEKELDDLKSVILRAKNEFGIGGVVTGAVMSVYQKSRIEKICDDLGLKCFNPLWKKEQLGILRDLLREGFEVIVVGVFAYPLNESWLGKKIDEDFIKEIVGLNKDWGINIAGEGGEFESFVLNCPLFKKGLRVKGYKDFCEGENSFRRELEVF